MGPAMKRALILGLGMVALGAVGCTGDDLESNTDNFSSNQATLLELEFDGELVTTQTYDLKSTINDQLLYTIGHLNGDRSVGRLDALELSNIQSERLEDGTTKVTYHAVLPVGWGSKTNLPKDYTFTLPRSIDYASLDKFATKYGHDCAEHGAHDVSSGNLWYYFRPSQSGCKLDTADVVSLKADVSKSVLNTDGKYPEYDQVWDDNELRVVAIFGKYESGATSTSDAGISAYNQFVSTIRTKWGGGTVTPSDAPTSPGVKVPDVEYQVTLADGKKLIVNALLVDEISSAPEKFYQRYEGLSTEADIIFYNGHAGLGQNVRALAKRGEFRAGKYQIIFMNGCDTFAYVDGSLAKTRSVLNPDDPTGTKYMDIVTNAMPAFFTSMPTASLALVDGLLSVDKPVTYQDIFAKIDKSQVVVVTGEEDNAFTPDGIETKWEFNDGGSVAKGEDEKFSLGTLPAGKYVVSIHEDQASPGGDADLYVGLGSAPTLDTYDFRPWIDGSNEEVHFTLEKSTKVFVMVHGYEDAAQATSAFMLSGRVED